MRVASSFPWERDDGKAMAAVAEQAAVQCSAGLFRESHRERKEKKRSIDMCVVHNMGLNLAEGIYYFKLFQRCFGLSRNQSL